MITMIIITATVMSQDFRNATWGMSQSEVKANETDRLEEETADMLVYKTSLAGFEAYAAYIFTDSKLSRAGYFFEEIHSNDNEYISDYNRLNGLIKMKYGEPVEDEEYWKSNSSYIPDKSNWGHEIYMGRLVLYSIYRTSTTEIELILSAEDYIIILGIKYTSLNDELIKLEEDKMLEGF